MLRACCLILGLVAATRQLSITDFAVPSEVKIGENAELQCRYQLWANESETGMFYVKWWFTPLHAGSDLRQQIYQRLAGHAPQLHHTNSMTILPNDTIVLLNLQPQASGVYECEVSYIDEVRQHHALVVYSDGTGPLLNISRVEYDEDEDDKDYVLVTCEADDVAPEPDLTIIVDGKEIPRTAEITIDPEDGLYSIFANVTLGKEAISGAVVQCRLSYKSENVTHEEYIATVTYEGSGEELTTTEAAEEVAQSESATDSLQTQHDGTTVLSNSWTLFAAALVAAQLH